jgi:putative copper resistance protein D
MVVEVEYWSVAMLLTKWVGYICFVTLAGGLFALGLDRRVSYLPTSHSHLQATSRSLWPVLITAAIIGTAMAVLNLLVQVGEINQRGLVGMFDWFMVTIIGQSPVGHGNALKLLGFLLLGLALFFYRPLFRQVERAKKTPLILSVAYVCALASFAFSFAMLGHVAPLNWLAKAAIIMHVGAMSLWIGALLPLRLICAQRTPELALPMMRAFGSIGWAVVVALLVGGVYLVFELVQGVDQLFTSAYGLLLCAKIILVTCLLCLAALNKFNLVSRLAKAGNKSLQNSIMGEILLGMIILFITAIMTTLTGPMEIMN